MADITSPPLWGWSSSAVGDGSHCLDYYGNRYDYPGDLAFTLSNGETGATVPEPSSFALLGLGSLGLLGWFRRKRG